MSFLRRITRRILTGTQPPGRSDVKSNEEMIKTISTLLLKPGFVKSQPV